MKYKIAFHVICLSALLSATCFAGVLNVEFVDIFGKPIPYVTVTFTGDLMTGSIVTEADGKIAINYPSSGASPSYCLGFRSAFYMEKPGFRFNLERGDYFLRVPCNDSPVMNLKILGTDLPPLTSVSAADYQPKFTSDMIATAFGDSMATATELATLPLKTTLADRRLIIKDSAGTEKAARLLFVSPTQINYISPEGLAQGKAIAELMDVNGNVLKVGFINTSPISPSIFTADASGRGLPAAATVRASSGYQVYENVYRFDLSQQKVVPAEIDLGPESETVVLVLFGTGWRQIEPAAKVTVKIGGIDCPVEYAGKQGTIEGLAQINVRLPRSLIGKGEVTVEVAIDGSRANPVQLIIK
jgi:uncharacterized protein (TIGR03437 family)